MYAIGQPKVVLLVVVRIQQDLKNRCGLDMQWNKTEWFSRVSELPVLVPPELKLAGIQHNINLFWGFMCYGITLGSYDFVSQQFQQKRKEIIDYSVSMLEMLSGDRQALWAMLCLSTMSRL